MSTSESPLNANNVPYDNEAARLSAADAEANAEPQERSKGSHRRILHLVAEMFGASPHDQIQGLLSMRNKVRDAANNEPPTATGNARNKILHLCATIWGAPENIVESLKEIYRGAAPGNTVTRTATDDELKAAYQRGRADLRAEIEFSERLSAIQAKYPDFDHAWASVRPLVPRSVLADMADDANGLEGAYALAKLPELCEELSALDPEKARERFKHFLRDLVALTKGNR